MTAMGNDKESLKRHIERSGFTVSKVRNDAHPNGLYVARKGNVAWFDGKTICALHRKIFGY